MKFPINTLLLLLCLALFAFAVEQPQRQVIVSYPKGTPEYVLEEAKEAVRKAVRRRLPLAIDSES